MEFKHSRHRKWKDAFIKANRFVPEMHSRHAVINETSEEIEGVEPVENSELVDKIQEENPPETESQVGSSEGIQFSMPWNSLESLFQIRRLIQNFLSEMSQY